MAGIFYKGETKVRPGVYYNVTANGEDDTAGAVNGVVAVLFRADFGPLNKLVEIDAAEGYESVFGTGLGTDAMKYAIKGGARKILAVRVGSGGNVSTATLKDESNAETVVELKARYEGEKPFSILIREKLTDSNMLEGIIYSESKEVEKLSFAKGSDEVTSFVEAFAKSNYVTAVKKTEADGKKILLNTQVSFTLGANPTVTNEDYASALKLVEAETFNVICLDTEERAVQFMMSAFLNRIEEAGQFAMGVVAEKMNVDLEQRMSNAAAFNDYKMHYVLNANVTESIDTIDGYQTAALMAGYIASVQSSISLTHTVLRTVGQINEALSPSLITKAEQNGCIVLSYSAGKNVWIDSAINTLITLDENHDAGWKKIRRTKTRFELMRRMNTTAEDMVGKVDNDANGRTTIVSKLAAVGEDMIVEGKLISCMVEEDPTQQSDTDSVWLNVSVVDKDSAEKIYLTFAFQFSTNQ